VLHLHYYSMDLPCPGMVNDQAMVEMVAPSQTCHCQASDPGLSLQLLPLWQITVYHAPCTLLQSREAQSEREPPTGKHPPPPRPGLLHFRTLRKAGFP